jgi:NAD(P)-dependent dehydrogenase (short-subunit alcohol dehydrogenase family)
MKDRVVFITGAKGGLGTYVTRTFLNQGATVVGASRSIAKEDFPSDRFTPLSVDFTQVTAVRAGIDSMVQRFGSLDVVVHVLGGFAGGQNVAETDDATWQQMQDLNLTAAFYVLRAAIPHLRKSPHGRILVVGSLAATEPHAALGAYVTFKTALATLVRTVALENKDVGLTANVILPGTIDTLANRKAMPGSDFSKWLDPQEVANLAVWLASEEAGHITGAAIPIDNPRG